MGAWLRQIDTRLGASVVAVARVDAGFARARERVGDDAAQLRLSRVASA